MADVLQSYTGTQLFSTLDNTLADQLARCRKERNLLAAYPDASVPYIITYPAKLQKELLDKTLEKYHRITFYNADRRVVKIVATQAVAYNTRIQRDDVLLDCAFVAGNQPFTKNPWLTTMLQDGSQFVPRIDITVAERIKALNEMIQELQKKIQAEKAAASKKYKAEKSQYQPLEAPQVEKEARTSLGDDAALSVAKAFRPRIQSFDHLLTIKEKRQLLEWICSHIYSLKVYGVLGGRSGNILQKAYPDDSGIHYRKPTQQDDSKQVAHDGISGELYFTDVSDAPEEILRKICSNKRSDSLFVGKRLCDLNLTLYLLSKYHSYGFVAGKKHLYKYIDTEGLLAEEFGDK